MVGAGILYVADEFLYPKNRGGRVETVNEVALLAHHLGHPLHLLVPRDPWTTPALEAAHRRAIDVPTTFFDRPARLRATLARPWLPYVSATRTPAAAEADRVLDAVRRGPSADLVIAAHDYMWPLASFLSRELDGLPVMVRSHNDEVRYLRGLGAVATLPLRAFFAAEAVRTRWQRRAFRARVDAVAVLAAADAACYKGARTVLVPPLLHDGALADGPVTAPVLEGRDTLLFVGALDAPLSAEGVEWLRREVMPALVSRDPGRRLRVVGRDAPAALAAGLRADPLIDYVGEVDDLEAEFARARVFVNPALRGSGVNMKMGGPARRGIPVVTTNFGARGLDALRPALAIADEPVDFAERCATLLQDDTEWLRAARPLQHAFAENFSVGAVRASFSDLIDELVAHRTVTRRGRDGADAIL